MLPKLVPDYNHQLSIHTLFFVLYTTSISLNPCDSAFRVKKHTSKDQKTAGSIVTNITFQQQNLPHSPPLLSPRPRSGSFSLGLRRGVAVSRVIAFHRHLGHLLCRSSFVFWQLGEKHFTHIDQQPLVVKRSRGVGVCGQLISVVVVVDLETAELEALVRGLVDADQVEVVTGEGEEKNQQQAQRPHQEHCTRVLHKQVL